MEENVQRIFAVLISTIIFFILPLYIAFEKKDDISYSLALKTTSDFVENVRNNGYLSKKMYDDYTTKLGTTANTYEILMEHKANNYYPVIYSYEDANKTKLNTLPDGSEASFDYIAYIEGYRVGEIEYQRKKYKNLVLSYKQSQEIYTEKQIINTLSKTSSSVYKDMTISNYKSLNVNKIEIRPNIYSKTSLGPVYTFNRGDEFTIRIKNKNTTIAQVLFNTLTAIGVADEIPRIYINYGGSILNERYKYIN